MEDYKDLIYYARKGMSCDSLIEYKDNQINLLTDSYTTVQLMNGHLRGKFDLVQMSTDTLKTEIKDLNILLLSQQSDYKKYLFIKDLEIEEQKSKTLKSKRRGNFIALLATAVGVFIGHKIL